MKIFIAGGTGFIGRTLIAKLTGAGHEVTVLVRNTAKPLNLPAGAGALIGDPMQSGAWQEHLGRQGHHQSSRRADF